MKIQEKATQFANGIENTGFNEKLFAISAFKVGYNECKSDLIEFIRANPKSTAEQILKHADGIV